MSRKTMDEFPDLYNIWTPPSTTHPQNDDTRGRDLTSRLAKQPVVRAYQRAWDPGHHLADATDAFTDSLWGINEGKKDVR